MAQRTLKESLDESYNRSNDQARIEAIAALEEPVKDEGFRDLVIEAGKRIGHGLHGQFGKVVDLRGREITQVVLVSDLHGRADILERVLENREAAATATVSERIENNETVLVIAGDAVHPAGQAIRRYRKDDPAHQDLMNDMSSSIQVVRRILQLKWDFPEQVFFLVGNHDNPHFFPPNPQYANFHAALIQTVGGDCRRLLIDLLDRSPLLFLADGLVAAHGGPIKDDALQQAQQGVGLVALLKSAAPFGDLFSLRLQDVRPDDVPVNVVTQLLLNMHRRYISNAALQYREDDVRAFFAALKMPDDATFVVGHDHDFVRQEQHSDKRWAAHLATGFWAKPFRDVKHYVLYCGGKPARECGTVSGYAVFDLAHSGRKAKLIFHPLHLG